MTTLASDKVDNFIESLNLPKNVATVLLESEKDCHDFFEGYYNRNKYVMDDLLDYREAKIRNANKTLDEFRHECYTKGMRQAFQLTFYQSFSDSDIELIAEANLKGVITLEGLFNGFKKNPSKNIMRNVL